MLQRWLFFWVREDNLLKLSQNEKATSHVFLHSLCSVRFKFFFDCQAVIHRSDSVWLTEAWLVTLVLREVSFSALWIFVVVHVITAKREEDSAFCNQLHFPPEPTRSAEESATAVAPFSKELCPSVALEHRLVSLFSLVLVPL